MGSIKISPYLNCLKTSYVGRSWRDSLGYVYLVTSVPSSQRIISKPLHNPKKLHEMALSSFLKNITENWWKWVD